MNLSIKNFQKIFESVSGNLLVVLPNDPIFTIVAVTDSLLEITSKKRDDLIGMNLFDVYPGSNGKEAPIGPATLLSSLQKVIRTGTPDHLARVRYDLIDEYGEYQERHWTASNKPLFDENGNLECILHETREVTDIVRTEQKADDYTILEKNFNLFLQAPVAVCILSGPDYIIDLANESMLQFLGRTPEAIKKPLIEVLPEAAVQGLISILDGVRKSGEPFMVSSFPAEIMIGGKREKKYFDLIFKPYFPSPASHEVISIFCVAHNVTEQVLARKNAEESEQQVRSFVESAPFPIAVYEGREMRIRFANQSLMDAWGKGNDVIGKTYAEVLPELENTGIYSQLDGVYTTGIPFQARNQRVDLYVEGKLQPFYFNYNFTPLFDQQGKVYGVMNTAAEVTDLVLAHKQIEESEQSLRNIILQAPVAMCIFKGNDYIIEVANKNMIALWGKTGEEVLNKPLFDAIPEARNQGYEELMKAVMDSGKPFRASELPVTLKRDGVLKTVFINFAYEPIRELNGTISGIIAMASEVTEQVVARKKTEESIAELQLAVEIADLGTFRVDLQTNTGSFSNRVKEWFGFSVNELPMDQILARVFTEDRDRVDRELTRSMLSEADSLHDVSYRVKIDDHEIHLRSFGKTFFNNEGQPYLIIGTIQNVTDQVLYELQLKNSEAELQKRVMERTQALENLNQELKRSNANLEEFAYAASHDMKEPIRKIHYFADRLKGLLQDKLPPDELHYFHRLETAAKRMQNLIDDLLLFSHISRGASTEETVDLNETIENVLEDLELEIEEKKARIEKGDLPRIRGNKRQLQQLFQNLVANSLKYTRPEVSPHVKIDSSMISSEDVPAFLKNSQPGRSFYQVIISDNGIGFEQADAERIFNVFTRLHGNAEYRGTGVGLSIVRKVAENHKGQILAEGAPGKGATFRLYLPAT